MTGPRDRPPVDVRAQLRQQMLDSFGGVSGMIITAIPTLVFVIANAIGSLRNAVIAAIASALALTGYRLSRKQPTQQALNGLLGVLVAALIAARTGQARGYFLLGIWSSFAYGGVFLISILARRPLVGVIWEFLDPTPSDEELAGREPMSGRSGGDEPADDGSFVDDGSGRGSEPGGSQPGGSQPGRPPTPWYQRRHLASAYLLATLGATVVFAARGVVQLSLFRQNSTGWLAVARIAMGYPLTLAVFAFAWYLVRRARNRLRLAAS